MFPLLALCWLCTLQSFSQAEIKNPVTPFWKVKGNSGTNSGTYFIGTTDNVSWRVRTNNTERMVVDSTGNVGIGTASPTTRLHVNGNFRLVDGTQAKNFVLMSDALGNATWKHADSVVANTTTGTDWHITGNAGTVDGTNFIGTTDNIPFNIRVNNEKAGRIDPNFENTFWGYKSGYSNTTGSCNTANGTNSLVSSTTGTQNTANGCYALYHNTSGSYNTANGAKALYQNTLGSSNTANGKETLYNNITGEYNTAGGLQSLYWNNTGSENTAIGYSALIHNKTGSSNTALGNLADVTTNAFNNATAIGNRANTNASDKMRFGNTNVSVIEGQVAYSIPSDARFKYNVTESDVKGLDFISRLRPVEYNFDTRKFEEFLTKNMTDSIRAKHFKNTDFTPSSAIRQSGFIAQEVEEVMQETGYHFNGVHKPANENDNYSVSYSLFVVPLVKAVQEQQQIIETLKQQNEEFKKQNTEMNERLNALESNGR